MIRHHLIHHLRQQWPDYFPDQASPSRLELMLLATGREPTATRIILAMVPGTASPQVAIKIPRNPTHTLSLAREHRLLTHLHREMPAEMIGSLPRPLEQLRMQGLPVYIQTAIPGQNQKTLIQRGALPPTPAQLSKTLSAMFRWLDLFQCIPPLEALPDELALPSEVNLSQRLTVRLQPLIHQAFVTAAQAELLLEVASRLDQEASAQGVCWVHGDLWSGNVLETAGQVAILDWDGLYVGHRWMDRVWYTLHLGMLFQTQRLGRADLKEGFRRILSMGDGLSEAVREALRTIAIQGGLPPEEAAGMVQVRLALEAGRVLQGEGRLRALDRFAADLLQAWLGFPEGFRL